MGSFVNSETGHSEDQLPNLRYALGSVKRVKVRATGDLRAHPRGVGHRPALPAYPRLVTDTPPWQVACRLRLGRAGLRGRAQAGSVRRIARRLRGKNVNLILAVARAGGGQKGRTSPSPCRRRCPVGTKKKKKGQDRSWVCLVCFLDCSFTTHQHAQTKLKPSVKVEHLAHVTGSQPLHSHARDMQRVPRSQTRIRVAIPQVNPGSQPIFIVRRPTANFYVDSTPSLLIVFNSTDGTRGADPGLQRAICFHA